MKKVVKTNAEILMEASPERVKYIGAQRGLKGSPSHIKKQIVADLTDDEKKTLALSDDEFKVLATPAEEPKAEEPKTETPKAEEKKTEPAKASAILNILKLPEEMKAKITFLEKPELVKDLRDCPEGSIVTYPSSTKPYVRVDQNNGSHKRIVSSTQQYVMNNPWAGKLWGSTTDLNVFGTPAIKTVKAETTEEPEKQPEPVAEPVQQEEEQPAQ
jgi:hypothetical protein